LSRAVTRLQPRRDSLRAGSHTRRSRVESRPGYVPTSDVGRGDSLLSPGGFLRSGRLGHGSVSPRTPRLSTDLVAQARAEFIAERFDVTTRSIRVPSRPGGPRAGRSSRRSLYARTTLMTSWVLIDRWAGSLSHCPARAPPRSRGRTGARRAVPARRARSRRPRALQRTPAQPP